MPARLVVCLSALVWAFSLPLACLSGPVDIPVGETLRLLAATLNLAPADQADPAKMLIVGQIRFSRVLLSLLCGGGLALAGAALQGVLHNPLADPFILGISAGAACGASLVIALGGGLTAAAFRFPVEGLIAPAALAGALAALAAALLLGRGAGGFARENVILAGVAVSAFLGALVALIKALNEESVAGIVFWIMGSFQGRGWDSLPLLCVPLFLGLLPVAAHWRELDVLGLGDMQAAQLGMNVGRARLALLFGASCMTAGAVAVAGVIGFVGLVVPHTLRLLMGAAHGPLLAASWFAGGVLLCWADVLARSLLDGGRELPVGVVTALLGGPFFAFLVHRSGKTGKIRI
jgi:iron complex transport system permease protein